MGFQAVLHIRDWQGPFTLIVEPWASEFEIGSKDDCKLIAVNPYTQPIWRVAVADGRLVASTNEGGTTFEFWRSEKLECRMPVATPSWNS